MNKATRILAPVVLSFLFVGFLAPEDAVARKKKILVPGYHSKAVEMEVQVGGPVLELGELPSPLPSRLRVVIQPNKGDVCFQCHKIPYPTAPVQPARPGEATVSSILTTHPGGWALLTSLEGPFHFVAGGWSPDGKKIAFDSDRMGNFDIWVLTLQE
ncbi:MAG: hypothetical protein QHH30_02865 [candidate division NC10 bacterium]|nr:hypothetical protein [candidate division NC10 bacterium]